MLTFDAIYDALSVLLFLTVFHFVRSQIASGRISEENHVKCATQTSKYLELMPSPRPQM